jgi:RNA polymerase sigma factor (sigma-70 family)
MQLQKEKLFTELYEQYAGKILKLCLGYAGNDTLAQDLMQDTFAAVWQSMDKFRGDAQYSTWIYRIAVNTCLGYFRSPRNKANSELKEALLDHPEEVSEKEQQMQLLYKCISELQETDRLIISMVLEDLPYAEIAEATGVTENNLRVKIHRIKQQLSTIYNRHEKL